MRALITGAGSDLGREIALKLAAAGDHFGLHCFSNHKAVEQLAAELTERGVKAEIFPADFRSFDAEALATAVRAQFAGLEVLIHSASLFPDKSRLKSVHDFEHETPAHWDEVFAVNAKAPFFLTQALLPLLRAGKNPCVISLYDTAASTPYLSRSAYSLSRSTQRAFTRLLEQDLAPEIRVFGFELEPLKAPDGMSEADREKLNWVGYADLLDQLSKILSDK